MGCTALVICCHRRPCHSDPNKNQPYCHEAINCAKISEAVAERKDTKSIMQPPCKTMRAEYQCL